MLGEAKWLIIDRTKKKEAELKGHGYILDNKHTKNTFMLAVVGDPEVRH